MAAILSSPTPSMPSGAMPIAVGSTKGSSSSSADHKDSSATVSSSAETKSNASGSAAANSRTLSDNMPPLSSSPPSTSSTSASEPSTPTSTNSSIAGGSSASHPPPHQHHPHAHSSVVPMYPYNVAMVPQNIQGGPMPDDSGITTRLPSICVDYLSHDWAEDDVWTSWKAMTKHKAEIANGVRLENASWRTWAKQRGNLKTISPETLNWLKDSDVTWLYGPLHTSVDAVPPPRIASANERLGLEPLRSIKDEKATEDKANKATTFKGVSDANSSAATVAATGKARGKKARKPEIKTKPILKHRSLSDILLPPNATSPVLEDMGMDFSDQSTISIHHARSDSHLVRLNSLNRRKQSSPIHSPRGTSPERSLSDSSTGSGNNGMPHKSRKSEHRHISFNHRVEQCIAVDSTEDARRYSAWNRNGSESDEDDDEEEEEEEVLTFRSSPRVTSFGPSALSPAPDREPHTIARLGPTTLKSVEQWPAPSPAVIYQNNPAVTTATAGPSKTYSQQSATNAAAVASASYNNAQAQQAAQAAAAAAVGASKRGPLYDYSNPTRTQSEWDPEDDDDYAMGMGSFDYFSGPDVGVADEYDTAQYGSTHLIAGTHNNYEAGSPSFHHGTGSNGHYPPYHNSGNASSNSATSSVDSSPVHSRRSSNNSERTGGGSSTSSSPSSGGYYVRGPYAPAASSKDASTPKRSILKNSGGGAGAEGDNVPRLVSSPANIPGAATPTSPGSSASSPTASPYGSSNSLGSVMATAIPQHVRPAGRRSGSDEGSPRGGTTGAFESRGRSTSRGSSSSLERASSADRRSNSSISPSSYSPPSPSIPGARPVSIVSSRRIGSYESLNVLGSGAPSPASLGAPTTNVNGAGAASGSRQLSDLVEEQSSESETETVIDEDKNSSSITIRKVSPPRSDSNASTPRPGSSPAIVPPLPPAARSRSLSAGEIETVEDVAQGQSRWSTATARVEPAVSPERSGLSRQINPDPILDAGKSGVSAAPVSAATATKGRPAPVVTADKIPPGPVSPPLIPAPTTTTASAGRGVTSTGAGAPRFRQPSPSHATTSTSTSTAASTDEDGHTHGTGTHDSSSFVPSLSNSPALDPTDLAGTQWSDEQVPSFARRSLLRAARGNSGGGSVGAAGSAQHRSTGSSSSSGSVPGTMKDGSSTSSAASVHRSEGSTDRSSLDSGRDSAHDDYGFGFYDDEGANESGLLGRTLEVAGTAKDLLGALSKNIWHFGRR